MGRQARPYLFGCIIFALLCVLADCSGSFFVQREPWRHEAEVECLNSGAIAEGAGMVRVNAIRGPGVCGADFPLRVSALGDSTPLGFADDLRPPRAIPAHPSSAVPPPWPITGGASPQPQASPRVPGVAEPSSGGPEPYAAARSGSSPSHGLIREQTPASTPFGRSSGVVLATTMQPVSVTPTATLACPIVSGLERWIAQAVQPAAIRWFGSPVSEIRQISAYSCRGMNGNPYSHISEHAFGNALDIASFTLADGRTVTVKNGWNGLPEEQGFLRDVQAAACDQFTTVLAPGSNAYHYDHIHVDLMRRADDRHACNPPASSGEEAAARAATRYAGRRTPSGITGALTSRASPAPVGRLRSYADDRFPVLPLAVPGNDGED
ncbi:MAG TPA: extensin family protein [Xanthobacteraceae bacterium]